MASSSTSSVHKRFKYDVFLSFRGEDVRKTFIGHLYTALDRQGIRTFIDDKRLEKGERIDNELIKSIQDSKFFIIVFSQNYASSSWCLNELVEIMKCQKNNEQIAYPVFYYVDPSEVRKQRELYGQALAKHNNEDVEKWRMALREAGGLSGYDVKNTANGHENEAIKQIVGEISNRLLSTYYLSNDEKLVGMETRIPHLLSCLDIGSHDDVRMIGIKGMGGIGKTTLARAIFERISSKFEGVSFAENVREISKASISGLQSLQKRILSDILKEPHIVVNSLFDGKLMMRNRLCGIKALVVLDDVDDLSQLEALAGAPDWFKPGSRIIVTTRNEQVLVAHGVQIKHANLLSDEEAICLFNMYAFKGGIPIEGYEEHSRKVTNYAAGLPLTVRVLGSLLRGQGESVWIDVLKRLKTIPLKETQDILELSYNSLENEHREIFLDVACLLKGLHKKEAIRILETFGFYATYGLRVLEQRSLITYSQFHGDGGYEYLDMHDHLQEMGLNIIRREHPDEPNQQSILWIDNEIKDLLVNELGTEATKYIKIPGPKIIMKGFRGMKNLKSLNVYISMATDSKCDEASQYFPNALQYLYWQNCPCRSLPKRFQAINLVALEMKYSKIEQLWEGGERKVLPSLKILDLSRSERMLEMQLTDGS